MTTPTKAMTELLRTCRVQLRDLLFAYRPEECCEHPQETIRKITAVLGDLYDIQTGAQAERTRPVEVLRCWSDSTWDTDVIDIPYHTPEDQIEQEAQRVTLRNLDPEPQADLVLVALYHLPEPDEDEDLLGDSDA